MKKTVLLISLLWGVLASCIASQSVWMQTTSSAWMQSTSLIPWEHSQAPMPFEDVESTTLAWGSTSAVIRVANGFHKMSTVGIELCEYGGEAAMLFDTDIITPELMVRPQRRGFDDSPEGGEQSEESPIGSPLVLTLMAIIYGGYNLKNNKK